MFGFPTPRPCGILAASSGVTGMVYWSGGAGSLMEMYLNNHIDLKDLEESYEVERDFRFYDDNRQLRSGL